MRTLGKTKCFSSITKWIHVSSDELLFKCQKDGTEPASISLLNETGSYLVPSSTNLSAKNCSRQIPRSRWPSERSPALPGNGKAEPRGTTVLGTIYYDSSWASQFLQYNST